jgi:hypothetical protein
MDQHHDFLEMKTIFPKTITQKRNSFIQVLPCIHRLCNVFDSIYPNIYQIHCSDSLRILNEIICLTNEYLYVSPLLTIPTNELLSNEKYFENFISELRRPSIIRKKSYSLIKTQLHCFGQGVDAYNYNNKLNQTILFCFELTNNLSLSIDIVILDPDNNLVPVDIKYINTYNQGSTKLYSCSYTPITKAGTYNISFFYNNIKLTDLQYKVFIRNSTSNYNSSQQKQQLLLEQAIEKISRGKY